MLMMYETAVCSWDFCKNIFSQSKVYIYSHLDFLNLLIENAVEWYVNDFFLKLERIFNWLSFLYEKFHIKFKMLLDLEIMNICISRLNPNKLLI